MKEFDELKNLWQHEKTEAVPDFSLSKKSVGYKESLQRKMRMGALMLLLTGIFIASTATFGNFGFKHWFTYAALVALVFICWLQALLMYRMYNKIKSIDSTAAPAQHLQQWQQYYEYRKKTIAWNMPLYYILLNGALGVYFIEVFSGRPLKNVILISGVYVLWMLYAYFILGKKQMQKDEAQLQGIINELKEKASQIEG